MNFDRALDFVLAHEGGYVNHPQDPGGETNWGISKRAYPDLDIAKLTRADAATIYRRDYWLYCRCGELPSGVDLLVFDAAVNQGPRAAIQMLQESINEQSGIKLKVDGVIGPITISALRRCDEGPLVTEMAAQRMATYLRNPRALTFALGWSRRLMSCVRLASQTYA